jgi:hypothetical protein
MPRHCRHHLHHHHRHRGIPASGAFILAIVLWCGGVTGPQAVAQDPLAGITPPSSWLASATVGAGREDQRFVILDGATPSDADRLFPGREIVTTQTTLTHVEWESPDAVVFGPTRATAATPEVVGQLLANGSEVVVLGGAGAARPAGPWPWRAIEGGWMARFPLAGPPRFVSPELYDTLDLRPVGRPAWVRRQVVLIGCLTALAVVAATLLPTDHRRAARVVVGVGGLASVAIVLWSIATADVVRDRVRVVVVSPDGLAQVDEWTFDRSPGPIAVMANPDSLGYPVLRSPLHERLAGLHVDSNGLAYRVERDLPMVLLRRQIVTEPGTPPAASTATLHPGVDRIARLYESPNVKLLGVSQADASSPAPTVWLRFVAPAPAN